MRTAMPALVLLLLCGAQEKATKVAAKMDSKLGAAVTVNRALFLLEDGEPKDLFIHFALVNEGQKVVNPHLDSSQLIVNGKKLKDWPLIIANGLRDERWQALGPGQYLSFGYAMKEDFSKPGVYKVSWRGKIFQNPEVVFRVMEEKE